MIRILVSLFIGVFGLFFVGWVAYVFYLGLMSWFTKKDSKSKKTKTSTKTPTIP